MPTEYYPDNAYYQLLVRILIRYGISNFFTENDQAIAQKLGNASNEILMIQRLIKKAKTNVYSRTQLRYILGDPVTSEEITSISYEVENPASYKLKNPVPSLFDITKDYINRYGKNLKRTANNPQIVSADVVKKFKKSDEIKFLDQPSTNEKITTLILGSSGITHSNTLSLLVECINANDDKLRKIWKSTAQIYIKTLEFYFFEIDVFIELACKRGTESILQSFIEDIARLFPDREPDADVSDPSQENDAQIKFRLFNQLFLYACQFGHLEIVKDLVKKGANINCCDNAENTGFHYGCMKGYYKIVEFLLKENPQFVYAANSWGETGLTLGMQAENPAIVKLLLENGARISQIVNRGAFPKNYTLVDLIKKTKNPEVKTVIFNYLQQHKSDVFNKQADLVAKKRWNILFFLLPGIAGGTLLVPGIIFSKLILLFALILLAMTLCCGLPIYCQRTSRFEAAIAALTQEESDIGKDSLKNDLTKNLQNSSAATETASLLADDELAESYQSVNALLNKESHESIVKMTVGKEEEILADIDNKKISRNSQMSVRQSSVPETPLIIKDSSGAAKTTNQSADDPDTHEFGGVVHKQW